jgi:hypothetical protein
MSLFRKKPPVVGKVEVIYARCRYCGKTDFIANMSLVSWIVFPDLDFVYAHPACSDKVQGMTVCATCGGMGRVRIAAKAKNKVKPPNID